MPAEVTAATPAPAGAMLPRLFRVRANRRDTHDTVTLELETLDGSGFAFAAGQFTMLQAFGVGEVPISISGDPGRPAPLVHTVRDVGGVTSTLCAVRPGDVLGARGPYGHGWGVPMSTPKAAEIDVVVVAGGIGLAPLRPALLDLVARREELGDVHVCYGARTPEDVLFADDLARWAAEYDVQVAVTVDRADASWTGRVGLVTDLLPTSLRHPERTWALICGPEVMMRYAAAGLLARGVSPAHVRLSLERNMRCGVGLCGHCQLREYLVCVDGPVFSLAAVQPLLGVREL